MEWLSNLFDIRVTDFLIVIFTGILASKTSGLYQETAALRIVADQQRADMLRSIKAAEDSARAAKLAAQAAIAIELPIIRCNLRQKLGFETVSGENGQPRHAYYVDELLFSNNGRTKSFPVEVQYGFTEGKALPARPTYTFVKAFPIDSILEEDSIIHIRLDECFEVTADNYERIAKIQTNLWFYCNFVYLDFMQTRHESGFCWKKRTFLGVGDFASDPTPAYNNKT